MAVTPVWPNLTAQPAIMGANVRRVSLEPVGGAWTLDLQALLNAVTPATRLLILNAPNNPTGWTLSRAEQQAKGWQPAQPRKRKVSAALKAYAMLATSAAKGAVRQI